MSITCSIPPVQKHEKAAIIVVQKKSLFSKLNHPIQNI